MKSKFRAKGLVAVCLVAALAAGAGSGLLATCGPFTDVAADVFCPFVLEIFYLGITTGTTATTYDPASNVSRLQMAAFLSRTVDGVLKRGSRRAALDQFWTSQNATVLGVTTLPSAPLYVASDGADIWASALSGAVSRVRASDGKLLETWTSPSAGSGIVVAMGRVLVSGGNPGTLALIDPRQPAGAVTLVASNLPINPTSLVFDGARFWTSNTGGGNGSVSIVTPGAAIPWTVTTITTGFVQPFGTVYDGSNVWVTDATQGKLFKLDASGAILQTVTVGASPGNPVFDGANIWVPNGASAFLSVVRASTGAVVGEPSGNGLAGPVAAAFDGQRILITSPSFSTVSLWKAADLTGLGSFPTPGGSSPFGACSDGVNFWIALNFPGLLARF